MIRWIGTSLLTLLLPSLLLGQSMPFIEHYDAEAIGTFPQHWSIAQDSSGYMYFGSQGELIQRFDGVDWNWHRVAGTGAIRSLQLFKSKIHWGGVGDLGYLESDSLYGFTLNSLKNRMDSTHQSFGDVWQIVESEGKLYHRTSDAIRILSEDTIRVVGSDDTLRGIFNVDKEVWVWTVNSGLKRLENDQWKEILGLEPYKEDRLIAILPYSDYNLLIFRNAGFVKYDGKTFKNVATEADSYLRDYLLYRARPIDDSEIALAFSNGGILIVNKDGTLQYTLSQENGLPTNTIHEIYTDHEGTLWAATVDGIIKILINNPVSIIDDQNGFNNAIKFIESVGDTLFVANRNRLFFLEKDKPIQRYPGIDQPLYDAINLDGTIYVSYQSGLIRLKGDQVENIDEEGNYRRLEIPRNSTNTFFGAHLNTIDQITIREQSIDRSEVLRSESEIRQFYADDDGIWAVTYQNEVLFSSLQNTGVKTYVPEFENPEYPIRNVSRIDNRIRLATDSGLFVYDQSSDSFVPDTTFSLTDDPDVTGAALQVFLFEQCSDDEIWFRSGWQTKRAIRKNNSWEIVEKPYRLIGAGSTIQEIHCNPDGSMWFGGSEGVFHLSDPDWTYAHDFNTNITGVLVRNDSLIYGGHGDLPEIPEFKFKDNELRFTYAAASYIEPEANTYRVRLRGYDDDWSNWSEETQKDYTFIPEGTYTFEVQGRNVYEKEGSIDSYTFTILTPWYRTIWAYLGYLLIAGGMIYGGYRVRLNTILREQRIRDGIARDLHDELSSTLSSINFFADAINSRKLGETENNRFLSLITKSSKEAKEKVSDIVWVIHSENDDWENLLLRCKRFAADMLDSRGVKHTFVVDGSFTGRPTITERKNIWLVFREIITNIARHAEAARVEIRFTLNSGKLHIQIEDNGKGFNPDNIRSDGYGVQNIRERTNQLEGKSTLKSTPGKGTRWSIEIPLDR